MEYGLRTYQLPGLKAGAMDLDAVNNASRLHSS